MSFARPNRTKTLFSQIDQNRPQAARTKLGAAMGAQSVLRGQTQAQNQENQNVQQAQQQVTSQTGQSVQALGMTPTLAAGQQAADNAQKMGQATPTFISSVQGGGGFDRSKSGGVPTYVSDSTIKDQGAAAASRNSNTYKQIMAGVDAYGKPLENYTAPKLSSQLQELYGTASEQLSDSEKLMTEGNLGQLAEESAFEQEQADLAQVLADRDSNIGKLRALYGVGYDSGKYGALDSNLLQGQFNELAKESKQNLETRESARKAGDMVRESYMDTIDQSRGELDTAKADTDKKIETLNGEISRAKEALEGLRGRTDAASKKAATKLKDDITAKTKEKDAIASKISSLGYYGGKALEGALENLAVDDVKLLRLLDNSVNGVLKAGQKPNLPMVLEKLSDKGLSALANSNYAPNFDVGTLQDAIRKTKSPQRKKLLTQMLGGRETKDSQQQAANESARRRQEQVNKPSEFDRGLATAGEQTRAVGRKLDPTTW